MSLASGVQCILTAGPLGDLAKLLNRACKGSESSAVSSPFFSFPVFASLYLHSLSCTLCLLELLPLSMLPLF